MRSILRNISIVVLLGLLVIEGVFGQNYEQIEINNPSFEEIPHKGGGNFDIGIRGWYDCGEIQFPRETPPDIHPINAWEVTMLASKERTYLGMVVRDNDTWESVSQRIKTPIEEGKCYKFSVDLARSLSYVSGSRLTRRIENYVKPAVLRIWGGTGVCGRQELLAESSTITKNQWHTYEFEFNPARTSNYFTIEAFYKTPALIPYNGHILVDNASIIERIPCDDEEPWVAEELVIEEEESKPARKANPKKQIHEERVVPIVEIAEESEAQKMLEEKQEEEEEWLKALSESTLKAGQVIPIHSIHFAADSFNLKEESFETLDQLYNFLANNNNIVIEIGGHTSTGPSTAYCNNLSTNRAKEVARHLAIKGISPKRIYYKGYGKRKPIIADDRFDMAARKINQRVEIKVLSVNYIEKSG